MRWRRLPRCGSPDRDQGPDPDLDLDLQLERLVAAHLGVGDPVGWFEPLYVAAGGDPALVPWARGEVHPYLASWVAAPGVGLPGRRAIVVGCGLGDDAAYLAGHGFEVTAFDVSGTAVAWASRRFPDSGVDFRVVDLLALPDDLRGGFDLVVEVCTVPSLPGVVREAAMHAIGTLARPGGVVVTIGLLATSAGSAARADGPPWPQAPAELAAYRAAGLTRVALEHPAAGAQGSVEVRGTWIRAARRPDGPEAQPTDVLGLG